MRSQKLWQILIAVISILTCQLTYAGIAVTESSQESLGQLSTQLLNGPVSVLGNFLYIVFYVAGGMMIGGSLIQYKAHRDNPLQVPISRPIFMLILGLVLVATPFAIRLTVGGSLI